MSSRSGAGAAKWRRGALRLTRYELRSPESSVFSLIDRRPRDAV